MKVAAGAKPSTTCIYDSACRVAHVVVSGATTTYGYDAFGARVYQVVATTSTSTYPFKFFSVASTTKSSNNFATSTEYIFNADTLLSTIDQPFKNGAATGTAQTRYVHPDHLGSTDVVTDQNQNLVQTLSYYPYGATRMSNSTSTNEKRKYIGQFTDDSGLSYLNARYYSSDRGQFLSQDPVFWEIGLTKDGIRALSNPQALNSYGYANDNPITGKDPDGRGSILTAPIAASALITVGVIATYVAFLPQNQQQQFYSALANIVQSIGRSVAQGFSGTAAANPYPIGVRSTPFINTNVITNATPWPNINLSKKRDNDQYGSLPTADDIRGKSPAEVDQILKDKGLSSEPGRGAGVRRYPVPGRRSDQVLIEPGNPNDPTPVKQGPYGRISQDGQRSDPIPLEGNPTLNGH